MISKGYSQINLRLSYDKIMFLSHQKVPKVANICSYSKGGWSLLIKRHSIKVTLKSLLPLASIEKSSKPDDHLQKKWCFYDWIVILFHYLSSKSRNSKVFTHSDFKMALSLTIIGSIGVSTLEFINNAST